MDPQQILCNGAKLCSNLGSWPACALVQLLIVGILSFWLCAQGKLALSLIALIYFY